MYVYWFKFVGLPFTYILYNPATVGSMTQLIMSPLGYLKPHA